MKKLLASVFAVLALSACDSSDISKIEQIIPAQEATVEHCVAMPTPEEHTWGDPVAPIQAWRAVTCQRGWTTEDTEKWIPFVTDVIMKESGGCWNLRRGAIVGIWEGCQLSKQGKYSDSGYGQLISLHYKLNPKNSAAGWLCKQEGLCSSDQIIATPESSMTALVAMVERSGKLPWCYDARARRYHNCSLAP